MLSISSLIVKSGSVESKEGFTLTELLTVITIIVILLGILIPGVLSIQKGAKRKQTEALFGKIINSLTLYRKDHGAYPDLSGELKKGDVIVDLNNAEQWNRFAEILALSQADGSAFANPEERSLIREQNPKMRRYFDLQLAELESDGGGQRLVDAFGNPHIYVVMDADLDGVVDKDLLRDSVDRNLRQRIVVFTTDEGDEDFPEIRSWESF
jgi:prepilin-type N-terminal cleavage/methylation domain-containing protein